jgi:hypothetical protein
MRILFTPKPTKLIDLDTWVKPDAKKFATSLLAFQTPY